MQVLVTGGTGSLGQPTVRRLLDEGHDVRVLSRRTDPVLPEDVACIRGDLATGAGLDRAVDGVDTIVHCASATGLASLRGRPVDVDGTRRLIHAARGRGGPHLVFISIVGIDDHPYPYFRTKRDAERIIEDSDLPWTILRTTQFHGFVAWILAGLARLPFLAVPKDVSVQPIAVQEAADRLVDAALGEPAGRLPDVGGPEVLRFEHLATTYLAARDVRRRVVEVPVPGAVGRALREGRHLCPARAVGTITWKRFLSTA